MSPRTKQLHCKAQGYCDKTLAHLTKNLKKLLKPKEVIVFVLHI